MHSANCPERPTSPCDISLGNKVQLYLTQLRVELCRVKVECRDGAVRLKGTVPSYYLRQLAIAGVKRVAGVRTISDELLVQCRDHAVHRAPAHRP